nr:hypothetical protein [Tanacetum cinerariifolium]
MKPNAPYGGGAAEPTHPLGRCCSGGGGWEMETMVRGRGVDEGDDGVDVVVAWFRWRWYRRGGGGRGCCGAMMVTSGDDDDCGGMEIVMRW